MESSCLRCGRCCTSFGVCITPFDMKRIARATGKKPEEFVDIVPEPPERERTEPAILIDGERMLLALKRDAFSTCFFYSGDGCLVYESRPMLCRSYPFRVQGHGSCLREMKSRACEKRWLPKCEEGRKYLRDCERYEKDVAAYHKIAGEWNAKGGGNLSSFIAFALEKAADL